MNTNMKRIRKAGMWASVGCVLVSGVLMSAQATELTAPASEAESLSILRQNAPVVARAIAEDTSLRNEVGPEKWPLALQRLAEFSKNTNPDYKEAFRIIGDTVTRVKSPVGTIQLDGDPSEWSGSIPPADYVRPPQKVARDVWESGAAAVVRQDRLYLMAGVANAAQYFAQPRNELHLTIDCMGDQAWDVCLSLSWRNGTWMVKKLSYGSDWQTAKPLPIAQGSVGTVAEAAIVIRDFVPVTEAKPIWTLYLEANGTGSKKKARWQRTKDIPVFNENARDGVAAWPYVRTFLCLCADKPLDDFELTAAAIAIMSSSMYLDSDEEVRKKIRADNAEFLEFARSIDAWQSEIGADYRLKSYPLEAQLAWAARIWNNLDVFLENSRIPGRKNTMDNYYWSSTSVETLKKLKATALREGLTDASLARCSERIDKWVKAKQVYSHTIGTYEHNAKNAANPDEAEKYAAQGAHAKELKANGDTVGTCQGNPVSEFRLSHSESLLGQIEKHGRTIGACGNHTHLCRDMMRALGIAPLGFSVRPSRSDLEDHVWPARYDPSKNLWLSFQRGRNDKNWWYFFINRTPVFSYAIEAGKFDLTKKYTGPRPFPFVFSRELQGADVKKTSQTGIPTQEVREWMLTPCY